MQFVHPLVLAILLLVASPLARAADAPAPARKPNIILITLDDVGWGDINCYTPNQAVTPSIDSLAKSGARCTTRLRHLPTL